MNGIADTRRAAQNAAGLLGHERIGYYGRSRALQASRVALDGGSSQEWHPLNWILGREAMRGCFPGKLCDLIPIAALAGEAGALVVVAPAMRRLRPEFRCRRRVRFRR